MPANCRYKITRTFNKIHLFNWVSVLGFNLRIPMSSLSVILSQVYLSMHNILICQFQLSNSAVLRSERCHTNNKQQSFSVLSVICKSFPEAVERQRLDLAGRLLESAPGGAQPRGSLDRQRFLRKCNGAYLHCYVRYTGYGFTSRVTSVNAKVIDSTTSGLSRYYVGKNNITQN